MTTLLSTAGSLTAGRCGPGRGERDFVAELLWRTPRRLLCGRAQNDRHSHDIPQRQRLEVCAFLRYRCGIQMVHVRRIILFARP